MYNITIAPTAITTMYLYAIVKELNSFKKIHWIDTPF